MHNLYKKKSKIDRLNYIYTNVLRRMDLAFENYLAQDSNAIEHDDIPHTNHSVWILGREYNAIQGVFNLKKNIFLIIFILFFIYFKNRTWADQARCSDATLVYLSKGVCSHRSSKTYVWQRLGLHVKVGWFKLMVFFSYSNCENWLFYV